MIFISHTDKNVHCTHVQTPKILDILPLYEAWKSWLQYMIFSRDTYISIFDCIYRSYFINNWNQRLCSKTWQTKHSKCMQLQLLWKRMTIKDGLWYIEILQTSKEYNTTSIIVRPLCASLNILYIFCVIVFFNSP